MNQKINNNNKRRNINRSNIPRTRKNKRKKILNLNKSILIILFFKKRAIKTIINRTC